MKCIILAAGYGTRLYPLTKNTSKSLLPIRGRPLIEHLVNKVRLVPEIDEICVVTNHRFYKYFQKWAEDSVCAPFIRLIDDGSVNHADKLGAIGDLSLVLDKECINGDVLVIGGDNLFSFPLDDFMRFSYAHRPHSIIGIYNGDGKYELKKFGVVTLDSNKKVIDFMEKPLCSNGSTLLSMCLYFFPKETLNLIREYLGAGGEPDRAGSYIQWLVRKGSVYGYCFQGDWIDIGDIDAYTEAVFTF